MPQPVQAVTTLMHRGDSQSNLLLYQAMLSHNSGLEIAFDSNKANEKLREALVHEGRLKDPFDPLHLFQKTTSESIVPFLPLHRLSNEEEKKACMTAFAQVLESGLYTSGPFTEKLEREFSSFLQQKHVLLCSSGTDAMIVALLALGIGPGDEVIMPANSFAATENAVLACGAIPVFCDSTAHDYLIDAAKIEPLVTARTKAILPVHLYGRMSDMKQLRAVADTFGLFLIEDGCQAIGATDLGKYGDIAVISLNPFKNMGVCGKAGGLMTNKDELAERCSRFSYHGFVKGQKNVKQESFGYNSRIDNTQSAIGLAKLPFLSLNNFKRMVLASRYISLLRPLQESGRISLPDLTGDHVWHLFSIQIHSMFDRDEVRRRLHSEFQVETDVYYTVLSHLQQTPLRDTHFKHCSLPNTETLHKRLLNLPLHPNMTLDEQDRVVEGLHAVL